MKETLADGARVCPYKSVGCSFESILAPMIRNTAARAPWIRTLRE